MSEDYLECVAKQQATLRPFGDIPRDMRTKVTRAFVTARSFVQGLIVSGDVVRKVSQVSDDVCVTVLGSVCVFQCVCVFLYSTHKQSEDIFGKRERFGSG